MAVSLDSQLRQINATDIRVRHTARNESDVPGAARPVQLRPRWRCGRQGCCGPWRRGWGGPRARRRMRCSHSTCGAGSSGLRARLQPKLRRSLRRPRTGSSAWRRWRATRSAPTRRLRLSCIYRRASSSPRTVVFAQNVLHAGGVWSEVEMSDRIRVNAARVGLVMQESSKEAASCEARPVSFASSSFASSSFASSSFASSSAFPRTSLHLNRTRLHCPCICDRESFRNTPRGGHQRVVETAGADSANSTPAEIAQRMREGKGSGILGGSGVA